MNTIPSEEPQNVVIVGATGNVGSELVRQIIQYDGKHEGHAHPTNIIGLVSSEYIIEVTEDDLPGLHQNTGNIAAMRHYLRTLLQENGTLYDGNLQTVSGFIDDSSPLKAPVVIDVTALKGRRVIDFHKEVLKDGRMLVTANKNPLSLGTYETFRNLTNDRRRYAYGPTVMAGGEAIRWLQQMVDLRETPEVIRGCFSGTLGYIASELEKGEKTFSVIVREAQKAGYTEPHPWDDLNGLDVARKAVILARSADIPISIRDIKLTPFIDEKYGEITDVEEFLMSIEEENEPMRKKMAKAQKRGNTLRYVAEIIREGSQYNVEVGLKEVPIQSELGQLKGTANIVEFVGGYRAPKECPHVIKTKGAGLERTAGVVRSSLLDLLPERHNMA